MFVVVNKICVMGLQAKLRKVQEAAGFVRVFELLRASGKPAVGHNCFFDLAFTLEHLAEPLPEDWPAFKQLVKKWFPGVKHLAAAGTLHLAVIWVWLCQVPLARAIGPHRRFD